MTVDKVPALITYIEFAAGVPQSTTHPVAKDQA